MLGTSYWIAITGNPIIRERECLSSAASRSANRVPVFDVVAAVRELVTNAVRHAVASAGSNRLLYPKHLRTWELLRVTCAKVRPVAVLISVDVAGA
ncbi:hypothetical protein Van01_12420 [Micromonospora andamanensis]|uniref:ATP-binding protein n=1 Tax=Micromonospora andamanensis TaxID=1287068 RepID=A0ABQ4HQV2_9ACTN|nr:hypothetical protein Van01_12420 [Micromonospora andamanensis]